MDDQNQSIPEKSAHENGKNPSNPNDQGSSKLSGSTSESAQPKKLSKEEQMAKFEEAMKNEDWGHQPC